jgi:hypothetical protein
MKTVVACIFLILLLIPFVMYQDASAAKASGMGARSFGAHTAGKVCGDRLCSEPENYKSIKNPSVEHKSQTVQQAQPYLTINEKNCPDYETKFLMATNSLANKNSFGTNQILNAPATIPLHQGYSDEKYVYYIITDTTYHELAQKISIEQCWPVQYAPSLSIVDEDVRPKVYIFANGLDGD